MAASPAAMSAFSSSPAPPPSTPTGAAGGRHLKRLSLGGSAFSPSSLGSPGSPSSPAATRSPGGSTRGGAPGGGGHGTRSLRLSIFSPSSSSNTGATGPSGAAEDSPSISRSFAVPRDSMSSISALGSPSASSSGTPSRLSRSTSNGHSRRMSSISYASSSREAGSSESLHGLGLGGITSPSTSSAAAPAGRARQGLGVPSPSGSRPISPVGKEELERSRSITPNAGSREEETDGSTARTALPGARARPPTLSRQLAAQGSAGGQPTLTEANADLLSFIAKKERKCLDLREELKRHEEELRVLKKKWEAIVAKSLVSSTPPTTTSMPRLSSPDLKRSSAFTHQSTTSSSSHASASSFSSTSSASPSTSPTPRHAPLHSLDLSLLSSTFDTSPSLNSLDGIQTADIEMPESVQAASKWVGGMFGKVLDAVNTLEEAIAPSAEGEAREQRELDTLREEEEPSEEGPHGVTRSGSVSSAIDGRRMSRASVSSVDSSSSFGFGFLGGRKSVDERRVEAEEDEGRTPTAASPAHDAKGKGKDSTQDPNYVSTDLHQRRSALTGPPPTVRPAGHAQGHGRSRSTFDVLSGVAGGGWGSLSKKWSAVTESETFKNSKKTTIGLLDTFEQGLATALGPLDPPPLSPIPDHDTLPSSQSARPPTAPSGTRSTSGDPSEPGLSTPTPSDQFDWSAFLDGDEPVPNPTNSPPPARGYKRPSLTPKPPISPGAVSNKTNTSVKSKRLSAQSSGTVKPDDVENWPTW